MSFCGHLVVCKEAGILVLLVRARQISDSGSVLYKKKFELSSSQCFVLICLREKIWVCVLVIESYY